MIPTPFLVSRGSGPNRVAATATPTHNRIGRPSAGEASNRELEAKVCDGSEVRLCGRAAIQTAGAISKWYSDPIGAGGQAQYALGLSPSAYQQSYASFSSETLSSLSLAGVCFSSCSMYHSLSVLTKRRVSSGYRRGPRPLSGR